MARLGWLGWRGYVVAAMSMSSPLLTDAALGDIGGDTYNWSSSNTFGYCYNSTFGQTFDGTIAPMTTAMGVAGILCLVSHRVLVRRG